MKEIKKVMKHSLIFDYDSTICKIESLELLAAIALGDIPETERDRVLQEIEKITTLAMDGKMNFEESLARRLALFRPNRNHLELLVHELNNQITPSFWRNRDYIRENADQIWVVSGGFLDFMVPGLVEIFGIREDHIFGNTFLFEDDQITGFDPENPLSRSGGKAEVVRSLHVAGRICVIGDGYTDYQIVERGAADCFIAFTENVYRPDVVRLAQHVAPDFEAVRRLLP